MTLRRRANSHPGRWAPVFALAAACSYSVPRPAAPVTHAEPLCTAVEARDCVAVEEVERWLEHPRLEILGAASSPRGIQGAHVLTLRTLDTERAVVFRAKWRPLSSTTYANVPRKELAAYAVQRLFLDPEQYVVPPSAAYCLDLREYRLRLDAEASPTFSGTSCVLGFLQYWLETARPLDEAVDFSPQDGPLDPESFRENPVYRKTTQNLNLLTFLIDHDDSHNEQFMLTGSGATLRIYSVDNSMSFGTGTNPELSESEDWSRIQVPKLPRDKLDRLARLRREDVEGLATLQELRSVDGRLLPSPLRTNRAQGGTGTLRWRGDRLQIGLDVGEREQLWRRLQTLLDSAASTSENAETAPRTARPPEARASLGTS